MNDMNITKSQSIDFRKTGQELIVIGDYYLDVDRIGSYVGKSREDSSLPIFQVEEEYLHLGGGGNLINNLYSLGATVNAVGITSTPATHPYSWTLGELLCKATKEAKMHHSSTIPIPVFEKSFLTNGNHIWRTDLGFARHISVDEYRIVGMYLYEIYKGHPNTPIIVADYEEYGDSVIGGSVKVDINSPLQHQVKFGTSRNRIETFRNFNYLVMNEKELNSACEVIDNITDMGIDKGAEILAEHTNSKCIIVTLGSEGVYFLDTTQDDIEYRRGFIKTKSLTNTRVDSCGCGDTFFAVFILSICQGFTVKHSIELANIGAKATLRKLFGTGSPITLEEMVLEHNASKDVEDGSN